MPSTDSTLEGVKEVIATTLGLEHRAAEFESDTPLFGAMPELDSIAVLELITALEDRFGIEIDGEYITADHFGTIGALSALVESLSS